MRTVSWCSLFLVFSVPPVMAQVQIDVRLDKTQYLAGEPAVVLIDLRNVGDEAVAYSSCDASLVLDVKGVKRRVPRNVFGCFAAIGVGGSVCVVDHLPLLPPGETATFRYLLKEYDLGPGQYSVTAVGKAGVQFDRTMPLHVVASTADELRAALAPLISAADATDPEERYQARAALIESAAPFLDSLIARLAATDGFKASAVEALGRMATTSSRAQLRDLFRRGGAADRPGIVLALARIGHRDDAEFFAAVLEDPTADPVSRRSAALGLGRIGGEPAVRALERRLSAAAPELRPAIATALGNTRSRTAVPVLIGMFGTEVGQNEVCLGLAMLTHRAWCDGTADDPAAKRTQWRRWWKQIGARIPIYGPDNCPPDSIAQLLQIRPR